MTRKPIKYIGYYDSQINISENRSYVLAATNMMDYMLGVLNSIGYDVEVISASYTRNRCAYKGRVAQLQGRNTLRLFRTQAWGGKLRRIVSGLSMRLHLLIWLLKNTEENGNLIVYHSLSYVSVILLAKKVRRFRLILEMGEVYADVTGREKDRKREYKLFKLVDAFIFPTELMNQRLNPLNRPYAVLDGTYEVEEERNCSFDDGRVHVVYAGTFDPRKGAAAAVAAAEFLDGGYHVHVVGFGRESDRRSLLNLIDSVSTRTECRVTYDGLLSGTEYIDFLQSCDIGLSVQRSDAGFNETSFPSKVLSYMANGLRVVSVRLRTLEESRVGDLIVFYEGDTPKAIAEAIRNIDLSKPYDSRARISSLDAAFVKALSNVLNG